MFVVIEQLLASRPVRPAPPEPPSPRRGWSAYDGLVAVLARLTDMYTGLVRLQGPFHHPNVRQVPRRRPAGPGGAFPFTSWRSSAGCPGGATIPVAVLLGRPSRASRIAAVLGIGVHLEEETPVARAALIAGVLAITTIPGWPAGSMTCGGLSRSTGRRELSGAAVRRLGGSCRCGGRSPLNGIGLEVIPTVRGLNFQAQRVGAGHRGDGARGCRRADRGDRGLRWSPRAGGGGRGHPHGSGAVVGEQRGRDSAGGDVVQREPPERDDDPGGIPQP